MTESAPLKKSSIIEDGWFKLILQRKLTVKKMDGRLLLISSNIAILYFKYGREKVVLWKKTKATDPPKKQRK